MPNTRNPVLEAISNPTKNFLATFLIGTLLFNLIANGLSTLFWDTFHTWLQVQLNIADKSRLQGYILALLIGFVLLLIYGTNLTQWLRSHLSHWGIFGTQVPDRATVVPLQHINRGLIVLMSPKSNSPAEAAIRHHWNQGQSPCLEHCWVKYLTQTNPPELVEVQVSYKVKPLR